ncbi:MAG: DUF4058 family protein [Chloroflexota bacterium]
MPSPFPGMDPYIEAPSIWQDFHHNLAGEIQKQLAPQLRPRYFAAVESWVAFDEITIEPKYTIKPDVSVWRMRERVADDAVVTLAPPPMIGRIVVEDAIRIFSVEIRETEHRRLITAIEILSPVNKRVGHEACEIYQRKRRKLLRSAAHLLEIDLLRAGQRWHMLTPLPDAPYFVFLSRVDNRARVEIWPLSLREPIPLVPVPLDEPDPDVRLDLGAAIRAIYDALAYDLRIDYSQPPPKPDLSPEDAAWLDAHLRAAGARKE